MRTTLDSLYTLYSARLAAAAAAELAEIGADPIEDTDDVTQEVWLYALQLLVLPEPEHAWPVLTTLLDQAIAALEASRHMEFPAGLDRPGVRRMPPVPLAALPSADTFYPSSAAAA
ncbi:hypothetical protein ACIBCB_37455 [Streptomyces uncialis]|uniref:hypothetical protein n=1 Tax=Streptomyces uncialis TaxID=1048205 RepID=UPI0037B867A9